MISIKGDLHNDIDFNDLDNIPKGTTSLIILGDFGIPWANYFDHQNLVFDINLLNKLASKPYRVYWLPGNHENYNNIRSQEKVKLDDATGMFRQTYKNVYMMQTGESYIIEGKSFFVFGGAMSIDKDRRTIGISWWPEEIPSVYEFNKGIDTLNSLDTVDYILTHTCPKLVFDESTLSRYAFYKFSDPVMVMLDRIFEIAKTKNFKKWYFGHFHFDRVINPKFTTLYHTFEIIK